MQIRASSARLPKPSRYHRCLHISNTARNHAVQAGITRQHSDPSYTCSLIPVEKLVSPLNAVPVEEFRQRAFIPETPILITTDKTAEYASQNIIQCLPAAIKWFWLWEQHNMIVPSYAYLSHFGDTIIQYETVIHPGSQDIEAFRRNWPSTHPRHLEAFLFEAETALGGQSARSRFCRFDAPLSLFLEAYRPRPADFPLIKQLYIAQTQIADLPKDLQDDLLTPTLVKEAGKGDIYDTSIWMGLPPTYTPLHRDPNPNLFVQLVGEKVARLYKPTVGAAIFREVQQRIGAHSSASFRGQEMMEGVEADALEDAVWGSGHLQDGVEATIKPGDTLFIPKGWWHSIKSPYTGNREVTASVNWWFR